MSFDTAAYLDRIKLAACPSATLDGLRKVQVAQMSAIACENIRELLGEASDLSPAGIWSNLVVAKKGGNAEEVNSLLGSALKSLGFTVRPVLCELHQDNPGARQRLHSAWTVSLAGQNWLVDAGLGNYSPSTPILENRGPQASCGALYRVITDPRSGYKTLQREVGGSWVSLYSYGSLLVAQANLEKASSADGSTSPADLIISMHLPNGRLTMMNSIAKSEADFGTREFKSANFEAFARAIRETFKLNYSEEQLLRVWAQMRGEQERRAA